MRVLLDTTVLRTGPSGTAVYIRELARALEAEGVTVVRAENARRRPPGAGSVRNALEDLRWVQHDLRRRARDVDVVHHPLPALTVRGPRPQVVTVHDLAFEALPGAFDPRFRRYARTVHRLAARHAAAVVVPSAATKSELARRWGVRDAVVARHGPGQPLPPIERGEPRHFLYVGDAEPRKDVPTLLDAYARYHRDATAPLPLILAGRGHADGPEGVRVVDAPSPEALAALHAHARALVHPSRHEGFGLTVAEALTAGTPVIAADTPAVREVAGDAARYVPPGDAAALAAALADPPPPAGAPVSHTWRTSALAHLAAYERAMGR